MAARYIYCTTYTSYIAVVHYNAVQYNIEKNAQVTVRPGKRYMEMSEKRRIKELKPYIPAADLCQIYEEMEDVAFLDSSLVNELGQYSILGLHPYLKLVKETDGYTVNGKAGEGSFEGFVRQYLQEHPDPNETELPIVSGAIGYFSYDYGREKEKIAAKDADDVGIPLAVLTFYDVFVVEETSAKRVWLIADGITEDAGKCLEKLEREIRAAGGRQDARQAPKSSVFRAEPNFEKKEYKQALERMIHYIIEGDIYIANMTQQFRISSSRTPAEAFRILRRDNPSPFGGYLNYGEFQIVCASPERFLRVKDGKVETRPIKGTRKRGATQQLDESLRQELEQSGKDRSELLMIVDLERNDLNRVCVPGSVKVTELFEVETYATVFHLVSTVEGMLQEGMTVMDLIEAAFPGGSITGAPKYRAMEIIDELECGRRNLYTGSIGYLTLDGACDLNIVIRTALYKEGIYHLGVGGGITAESETEFEYEETLQKAKAILEALR